MSTFKTRLVSATDVLELFLQNIQKADKLVDPEVFLKKILEKMGIDDTKIGLDTLEAESTTFEDFQKCLDPVGIGIPLPRAKLAWSILKGESEKSSQFKETADLSHFIQTIKPIGQWSDFELLEKYGKDCPLEIEDELKRRSKDRNCIIFFEDGTVDSEKSLYVFRKARYQETPSTFMFKDEMKQVFKVGEYPLDFLFECPLHKNVLLVDGYCEECGITWDTKKSEHMILLRLIREETSSDPMLYRNMDFDRLIKEFPKVYIKFNNLKNEDKLPSLKRRISKVKEGDPFRVSTHRQY